MKRHKYYCLSYKTERYYNASRPGLDRKYTHHDIYVEFRGNLFRELVRLEDSVIIPNGSGTDQHISPNKKYFDLKFLDLYRMSNFEDRKYMPNHLDIDFRPVTKKEIMLKKISN